jgi:hypothetical protein
VSLCKNPTRFRHRNSCLFLSAADAVSVQFSCASWASWAESRSGKPGQAVLLGKLVCKIITNGFRSTRLLRQKRFRQSDVKPTGQRATQASQANCAAGQAGLQNQNKRLLVSVSGQVISNKKVAF